MKIPLTWTNEKADDFHDFLNGPLKIVPHTVKILMFSWFI